MIKMKEMLNEYLVEIKKNKIKLLIAIITTIILYIISSIFLFTGINKRFLIYSFLCLAIGCFIALPRINKWYINLIILGIYLLIVPKKLFERMELAIHTMERILPGAMVANVIIILFVFAVCLLLFQRVRLALGIGNILLLVCFLTNYIVVDFRGTSITFNDFWAAKTAMQVVDNYQFSLSPEAWYSVLYFLFFIFWGFWIDIYGKGVKYHIAITGVAITGIAAFLYFWNVSDYLERHELRGHYWNMSENQQLNGFLLSYGISIRENGMEKPDGYSQDKIDEIIKYTEENYSYNNKSDVKQPNIIMIMNEAWSDLSVLGEMETSEDYMPFVNSLSENIIKGNLYVGILGGLTANTEFEVLTGDSLTFLAPGAIPYQLQVNHDMLALPSVLKERGYQTLAMHAGDSSAWNREAVYDYFGFDKFIDANDFQTEWIYERSFISDACNYNEIIYQYENRDKSKPWFLFNVTIQNHGDYYGGVDMPIKIESIGGNSPEGHYLKDAETYINLIKISDNAFSELVAYFSNVSEPTIICMFGDHQPRLGETFYSLIYANSNLSEEEKNARKYITPYIIWSNYDMETTEYGDMSANYLGAAVLEYAGIELPSYYKMLLNLQKEYPIISSYTINEISEDPLIVDYKIMQYQQLIER